MISANVLRRTLSEGRPAHGLWVTLESPTITEIACLLGFDYVVIDAEHGHLDYKEILEHIRAARNTGTTALVRIPEIQQGYIKRILDLGAAGILVPQVYGADEVEKAVRFAKYPPRGIRGVGGERATLWGRGLAECTARANAETMVIPLMETVAAGQHIDAILDIPGVDAIQFGPADYSSSAGYLGAWEGPGVAETLLAIKDRICARGVPVGVLATSVEDARMRQNQGFRLVAVATDTGLLLRGAADALKTLRPQETP